MTNPTPEPVTPWTVLRPLLGLAGAVGFMLLCVVAITKVSGPLVQGPYAWVGNVIVLCAFIGILVGGCVGVRFKVAFIIALRRLLFG